MLNTLCAVFCLSVVTSISAKMLIGQNMSNPYWFAPTADPFVTGVNNVSGSDPWRPEFIAENSIFHCLRIMDYTGVNNGWDFAPANKTWEGRTLPTSRAQKPVAWEWIADMCNKTNTNLWICLPHYHDLDLQYQQQLGALINSKLNKHLQVYLEFSNETWNGASAYINQTQHCIDRGVALNLPGMNRWYQGWAYHAVAAINLYKNFSIGFGDTSRINLVISGQADNFAVCAHQLSVILNPSINPERIWPKYYSIAPYFSGCTLESMRASIKNGVAKSLREHNKLLAASGLPTKLICYEGGQHCFNDNPVEVNRKPEMYGLYRDYLDTLANNGIQLFMHLASACQWDHTQAFGSKEYIGQDPANAHKYRALADYINEYDAKQVPNPTAIKQNADYRPSSTSNASGSPVKVSIDGKRITGTPTSKSSPRIIIDNDAAVPTVKFNRGQ